MLQTLTLVFTGLVFVAAGLAMRWFPPKGINYYYGYRTKRSMRDEQSWNVAQDYSASLSIKLGALYAIAGLAVSLAVPLGPNAFVTYLCLTLAALCMLIFVLTERQLRKHRTS